MVGSFSLYYHNLSRLDDGCWFRLFIAASRELIFSLFNPTRCRSAWTSADSQFGAESVVSQNNILPISVTGTELIPRTGTGDGSGSIQLAICRLLLQVEVHEFSMFIFTGKMLTMKCDSKRNKPGWYLEHVEWTDYCSCLQGDSPFRFPLAWSEIWFRNDASSTWSHPRLHHCNLHKPYYSKYGWWRDTL